MTPGVKELLQRASAAVAGANNVSYPSRVAAQRIRDLVRALADKLDEVEKERRRLAELTWTLQGHKITDTLV